MKDHAFQVAINQKYRDKVKPGDGRFWLSSLFVGSMNNLETHGELGPVTELPPHH
jgi:hypothetical protein